MNSKCVGRVGATAYRQHLVLTAVRLLFKTHAQLNDASTDSAFGPLDQLPPPSPISMYYETWLCVVAKHVRYCMH